MERIVDNDNLPPVRVGIADFGVSDDAPLTTSGLGSCLGVALFDTSSKVGGLLHPMLPYRPQGDDRTPATYVDTGIITLLDAMERIGAARPRVRGKIAGGAAVLELTANDPIGERNIEAAHEILDQLGVDIISEDVGGSSGRTVTLDPLTGEFSVKRSTGETIVL